MKPTLTLAAGPVRDDVGGLPIRAVSDGERTWSEVWRNGAWVPGGVVSDALEGFRLRPEEIAALGDTALNEGDEVMDSPGRPAPTTAPAPSFTLDEGPVWNGGSVLRAVTDGEWVWSEVWTGPAGGWIRGGTVAETLEGFPVTPEDLATLGIPVAAIGSPVTDSPGRALRPAPAPAPA